jgi:hypothetical protein
MDTPIVVAVISAAALVFVPAISFYLTKKKDREADWRKYKFDQYKEFTASLSGIVGKDSTPEGRRNFARASNTLHLIGSSGVLTALHEFQDETSVSNTARSDLRHDALLSKLIWEIRKDLGIPQTPESSAFVARLWCSGVEPASPPDRSN